MIALNLRWALPISLLAGIAAGVLLVIARRKEHLHAEHTRHRDDLHAWEDEGGNVAPPDTARGPASAVPDHSLLTGAPYA